MGKFSNGFKGGVHLVSRYRTAGEYCTCPASDLLVLVFVVCEVVVMVLAGGDITS